MGERTHALAQLLFGKSSVEDCTSEEIQHLSEKYPYFAPAHFLLVQKTKGADATAQQNAVNKAVLYHHDPLQFDYFVNEERFLVNKLNMPQPETAGTEEPAGTETEAASTDVIEVAEVQPVEPPDTENQFSVAETAINEVETDDDFDEVDEPVETSPLPAFKLHIEAISSSKQETIFEPYHTVDYFASQGINPSQDVKPEDKFGKQLRSFTDWLKTMKKLPAAEATKHIDVRTEEKIENLAAHSVDQSEIVTEAMAEVWEKQGNVEKAIETYNKLSLQNPAKSAFFAAKIKNLKQP